MKDNLYTQTLILSNNSLENSSLTNISEKKHVYHRHYRLWCLFLLHLLLCGKNRTTPNYPKLQYVFVFVVSESHVLWE